MTQRIPPGVELTERQKLACAFRILAASGWSQNMAGHITYVADDQGNLLCNPRGLWWDEITASDLCLVDADGRVVEGSWDVTRAISIHTELHRQRADARVVVHNHPYHATLLAGLGVLPDVVEQTGCLLEGDVALYNEFTGIVDSSGAGQRLADGVGKATAALLANHGALVTGTTIEEATYRAVSLERTCRFSHDAMVLGRRPTEIPQEVREAVKRTFLDPATIELYWNGAVRLLLRDHPDVLG